jgi:predicted Zn finger-like uncharacterized protein
MKVTTVYPSVVMRISCPYCEAEGRVRKEKPPQEDFTVVCPRCKEKFLIKINVRNFYRKTVSIPVYYSPYDIHRPDDQRAREANIVDISQQGMGVEGHTHDFPKNYFREGSSFTFLFSLPPRKELLKVQGEIARIIPQNNGNTLVMGVKFSNLDHFTNKQLGFFLLP